MYIPNPSVNPSSAIPTVPPSQSASATKNPLDAALAAANQTLQSYDMPLYGMEQYTPYEYAKRYMTGWGSSGYVGMGSSEEWNAQMQGSMSKAVNGTLKGVGVATTSFIDGSVGLVAGLMNWAGTGFSDFSKFYDNPITNAMEDFRNLTEEWLPNFYSVQEKNADWYSPDNWATANFIFDKFIKNAGFAVAALGSGMLAGKLLQSAARATKLGRLAEAAHELEQGIQAVNQGKKASDVFEGVSGRLLKGYMNSPIDDMTKIESISARAGQLQKATTGVVNKTAAVLATAAEANAEALQGYRRLKEDLVAQYEEQYGKGPDQEAMKAIDDKAAMGGNVRFGMNVLTLGISNMVQFPKLIGGSLGIEKNIVAKEIDDVVVDKTGAAVAKAGEKYVTKASLSSSKKKIFDGAMKKIGAVQLSEGAEEGMQYAIEEGVHEYAMMARDPRAMDMISNIFQNGLGKTFSTKEGKESMLLGVLTGGLMNAISNWGKGAKRRQNTDDFLKTINDKPQAGAFVATYNDENNSYGAEMLRGLARGFAAEAEKEQAHAENNMVKVKDADAKAFIAYALPRIKYGRFDMVMDELDQYSKRDFEEVHKELGLPETTTKEQVDKRINSLKQKAKTLKNLHESMTMRFGQETTTNDEGKKVRKYSDAEIDELVYSAYRVADYERRFDALYADINVGLSKALSPSDVTLDALFKKENRQTEDGKELDLEQVRNKLSKQLKSIRGPEQADTLGMDYLQKLKDLEEIQNKREQYLYKFEDLKKKQDWDPAKFNAAAAGVEDYLDFERLSKQKVVIDQLDRSTGRRPKAYMLDDRINEGLQEGKELNEILDDIKNSETFLYDEMKPEIKQRIEQQIQQLADKAEQTREEAGQLDWEDPNNEILNKQADEYQRQSEALQARLAEFENVETEPTIGSEDDIKRKVADGLISYSDVFLNAAESDPDYGDERTIEAIEQQLAVLKNLKKIFTDRQDGILKTDAFAGFMDNLNDNIAKMEALLQKVKENVGDREKLQKQAITDYYGSMKQVFSFGILDKVREILGDKADELMALVDKEDATAHVDIVYDYIKEKGTDAQQKAIAELVNKAYSEVAEKVKNSNAAKNARFKDRIDNVIANPRKGLMEMVSMLAGTAHWKTADNAMGRFALKHQNPHQLIRELEAEAGSVEYNMPVQDIVELLKLYNEIASLRFIQDYLKSGSFKLVDTYATMLTQVREDNKKGLPTPTAQQQLAIREALMYVFLETDTTVPQNGWVYLEGVIGAGKTSVFGKYFLSMLSRIKNKDKATLVEAVADTLYTSENINQGLGLNGKSMVAETIDNLNNDKFTAEFLIVDEMARLDKKTMTALGEAIANFNQRNKKDIRLIGLGDRSQIKTGSNSFNGSTSSAVNIVYPMSVSYRSDVATISDLQNKFKMNADPVSNIVAEVSVDPAAAGAELVGVAGSKSEAAMLSTLKARTTAAPATTKMLIVDDGTEAVWQAKLDAQGIQGVEVRTAFNAQGQTRDEVFMWLTQQPTESQIAYNTRIYTSARGKNFIYLGNFDVKSKVNASLVAMAGKNKKINTDRGSELEARLDKDLKEFDKFLQNSIKTSTTTSTATTTTSTMTTEETEEEVQDDNDEVITSDDVTEEPGQDENVVVNTGKKGFRLSSPKWIAFKKRFWSKDPSEKEREVIIVPIRKKDDKGQDYIGYAVLRETPAGLVEHAVLSNKGEGNEVDQLGLREDFNDRMKMLKNGGEPFVNFKVSNGVYVITPQEMVYMENNIVKRAKIVKGNALEYNYDYNKPAGIFSLRQTLTNWFNSFFQGDNEYTLDEIVSAAKIKTFNKTEAEEANAELDEPFVKQGRTYIVIDKTDHKNGKTARKQYIELKGRVLTDKDGAENELHRKKVLEPVREFLKHIDSFNSVLDGFKANNGSQLIRAAMTADGTSAQAFNLGHPIYNRLITLVADNNWPAAKRALQSADSKKNQEIQQQIDEKTAKLQEMQAKGLAADKAAKYEKEIDKLEKQLESKLTAEEIALFDGFFSYLGKNQGVSKTDTVTLAKTIDNMVYGRQQQKAYFYEKDGKQIEVTREDINAKNDNYKAWVESYGTLKKAYEAGIPRTVKDMDGNEVADMGTRKGSGPIQHIMNQLAKANRLAGNYWLRSVEFHNDVMVLQAPGLLTHKKESKTSATSELEALKYVVAKLQKAKKISEYPNGFMVKINGKGKPYPVNTRSGIKPDTLTQEDLFTISQEVDKLYVGNYTYEMLQDIFSEKGFKNGENVHQLRMNVPLKTDWNKPQTVEGKTYTPEQYTQNMLETHFVNVRRSDVEIEVDGVKADNTGNNTANPSSNNNTSSNLNVDDSYDEVPFLKKERGDLEGTGKLKNSKVLEYIRKFIPGITEEQLQLLNPLAMMRAVEKYTSDPVYGAFVNGVIMLETAGETVYKEAARHEVFHKIFKNFTTDAERKAVLKAAREEFGLKDMTDYAVEEHLADTFQERKDDKGFLSQVALVIKRFFRKVGSILGFVSKNKQLLESYFEAIESGVIGGRTEQAVYGFNPKRKFEKDYGNDIELANKVKTMWLLFQKANSDVSQKLNKFEVEGKSSMVSAIPSTIREIKEKFIRFYTNKQTELLAKEDRTEYEEEMLRRISKALTRNNKGQYHILNDLITDLFPQMDRYEIMNEEEFNVGDEEVVATLSDLINKDDNVNIYSKLTDNVRRFLSTIIIGAGDSDTGVSRTVRTNNALAKLYRSIESFNTENLDELRQNIEAKFQENYNVTIKNGQVVSGSPDNKAVLQAVLDLFHKVESRAAVIDGKKVTLFKQAKFIDENTFEFFGEQITREGSADKKQLEQKIKKQQENGEEVEETLLQEYESFKVESTQDFFTRISAFLRENEEAYKQAPVFVTEEEKKKYLSDNALANVISHYWSKSEALNTFQDLMNLINSLYDVQPMVGKQDDVTVTETNQYGSYDLHGYASYSLQAARVDKEAVTYSDNLSDMVVSMYNTPVWNALYEEARQYNNAAKQTAASTSAKQAFVNKFYHVTKMKASTVIVDDKSLDKAFTAAVDMMLGVNSEVQKGIEENLSKKDEDRLSDDQVVMLAMKQQKKRLGILSRTLAKSDNDHSPSTYYRADGKKQFFQRYIDFAQRTLLNIVRSNKREFITRVDDFMNTDFYKANFFNPKSASNINKIYNYGLHDSIKEENDVTLFSDESEVDFLKRSFLVNFGGMLNRRSEDNKELAYAQSYYTISNKSYMKMAFVGILDQNKIKQGIHQALLQEFRRPDPNTEVEVERGGKKIKIKPYNIKNYKKNWKKSFLTGVDQQLWNEQRENFHAGKDLNLDTLVNQVMTVMNARVQVTAAKMMEYNGGKFSQLIFDRDMNAQYQKLVGNGILTKKDFEKFPDQFELSEQNGKLTVKMINWDPRSQEKNKEGKELRKTHINHIAPMVKLWYMNNYINGLMLNQITVGDQAMFKNEYDEIKRMSIFHGIGQNMTVGEDFAKRTRRVLVIEDIKTMYDQGTRKTDYEFEQALREATGMAQINWSDGQGFMSQRSFDMQKRGFGPGANLQNIQKPIYAGIDEHGVNRTMKYSSVVISDALAYKFPLLRQMRLKMELNGLTGADLARGKELLNKQIDSVKTGEKLSIAEFKELQSIFAKNNDFYIDETVFDSATKTGIPEGRLKFEKDFNRSTGTYRQFENDEALNEDAIIQLDNRNWRIQLNPSYEIDAKVPLFTQLMYFANFDGKNRAEATTMFETLAELFDVSGEQIAAELIPADRSGKVNTHKDRLMNLSREERRQLSQNIANMVKGKVSNMAGKEKTWEFLEAGISPNAPFLLNEVMSSMASFFNSKIQKVNFPGSKFVLQAATFTQTEGLSKGVPRWNPEENIMEVYLPDTFKKFLPKDFDYRSDEILMNNLSLGWRVPSTGLNSTVRIKVLDFYPSDDNIVIAPPNITFQQGSDYDVDSLFIARYATVTDKLNRAAQLVGLKYGDNIGFDKATENKDVLLAIEKRVREDHPMKKELVELKKLYLKNKIIHTYMNLLSKKENMDDITKPISFDAAKSKTDPNAAFNIIAYNHPNATAGFKAMYEALQKGEAIDTDKFDSERESILFSSRDLNDVLDIMQMQMDNKAGTKLTGVIANSIKGISYMLQSTSDMKVELHKNLHFEIDGEKYDAFTNQDKGKGENQKNISETLGWMVNAAIDNVKEQILPVINMNLETGNTWMGLMALGIPFPTAVKLMTQPYIKDIMTSGKLNENSLRPYLAELQERMKAFDPNYQPREVSEVFKLDSSALDKWMNRTEIKAESAEELEQVIAAVAVLTKASVVGQDLFAATQALSILQENKNGIDEQERIIEAIMGPEGIYQPKMISRIDRDGHSIQLMQHGSFAKGYPLREGYAFRNIDLFKLPHWRSAWIQNRTLYDLEKGFAHQHHPLMDELARFIISKFKMKTAVREQYNSPTNRKTIREELVKYFLSGLKFNYFGKEMNFSTIEEPAYKIGDNEIYGAEAFIQRFIEKVKDTKAKDPSNGFLNRLRITKGMNGLNTMSITDIGGLQEEDAKLLEMEFIRIDEDQKKEALAAALADIAQRKADLTAKMEGELAKATNEVERSEITKTYKRKIKFVENEARQYKYSDFQRDFVKYLALAEGLRFGSTTFTTVLPADLYRPVFNAFDKFMYDTFDPMLKGKSIDELKDGHAKKIYALAEHAGLQLVQKFSERMERIDRFYRHGQIAEIDGRLVFYNGTKEFKTELKDDGEVEMAFTKWYNELPMVSSYEKNNDNYLMVNIGHDGKQALYQTLGPKNGNEVRYQYDQQLLENPYRTADYFNPNIINFTNTDVQVQGGKIKLFYGSDKDKMLSVGDTIRVHNASDSTRMFSKQYDIVGAQAPKEIDRKAINAKINELKAERLKTKDKDRRKALKAEINALFDSMKFNRGVYELREKETNYITGTTSILDVDMLRDIYDDFKDFDLVRDNDDAVLNFHNNVIGGYNKSPKSEAYYQKVFSVYQAQLAKAYPEMSKDNFMTLLTKERDNLLSCL